MWAPHATSALRRPQRVDTVGRDCRLALQHHPLTPSLLQPPTSRPVLPWQKLESPHKTKWFFCEGGEALNRPSWRHQGDMSPGAMSEYQQQLLQAARSRKDLDPTAVAELEVFLLGGWAEVAAAPEVGRGGEGRTAPPVAGSDNSK